MNKIRFTLFVLRTRKMTCDEPWSMAATGRCAAARVRSPRSGPGAPQPLLPHSVGRNCLRIQPTQTQVLKEDVQDLFQPRWFFVGLKVVFRKKKIVFRTI